MFCFSHSFLTGYCQVDPLFPWINLLGEPRLETITSEGHVLHWEDVGIKFNVPPGAVPECEQLDLTVRTCLSGSFVLPEGYELVSPVYLITPSFKFSKMVELSIAHFANVKSEEDCDNMTFVSAPCTPHYTASGPQYRFRALAGGVFLTEKSEGSLSLKHFCGVGVAKRTQEPAAESTQDYAGEVSILCKMVE